MASLNNAIKTFHPGFHGISTFPEGNCHDRWILIQQKAKLQTSERLSSLVANVDQIRTGISETEKQRRRQSNSLSTKINFLAWIIEVNFWIIEVEFWIYWFGGLEPDYLHHHLLLTQFLGALVFIVPLPIHVTTKWVVWRFGPLLTILEQSYVVICKHFGLVLEYPHFWLEKIFLGQSRWWPHLSSTSSQLKKIKSRTGNRPLAFTVATVSIQCRYKRHTINIRTTLIQYKTVNVTNFQW